MTPQQQIYDYLTRFESHLQTTSRDKEEILREIEAHIRDSAEQDDGNVAFVLSRLGEPEALADQYRDFTLLQKASRSISPLVLLRAAIRVATKGVLGAFVLVCGVLGYAFGTGLVLIGLIKPIAPAHSGLWIQNGVPVSSGALVMVPPPPAHEVLGWWLIPIALILGALILFATTYIIRRGLRHFPSSWQDRFASLPIVRHVAL